MTRFLATCHTTKAQRTHQPPLAFMDSWSVEDVCSWLGILGLDAVRCCLPPPSPPRLASPRAHTLLSPTRSRAQQHKESFAENDVSGLALTVIDEETLGELGVTDAAHVARIITEVCAPPHPTHIPTHTHTRTRAHAARARTRLPQAPEQGRARARARSARARSARARSARARSARARGARAHSTRACSARTCRARTRRADGPRAAQVQARAARRGCS